MDSDAMTHNITATILSENK